MGESVAPAQTARQRAVRGRETEPTGPAQPPDRLACLQGTVGNHGMQQLLGGFLGQGAPLPSVLRAENEQRFGLDFSQVRVHDHAAAHQLAQDQLARAFTRGCDIVFNRGFYSPATLAGRRLIAHELAHVAQQHAAGAAGASGPAHEAAADAAAQATVNDSTGPLQAGPAAAIGIQCEPLTAPEIAALSPVLQGERLPDTYAIDVHGTTTFFVRGVAILHFPSAQAGRIVYGAWGDPKRPGVAIIRVRAAADAGAVVDPAALTRIGDIDGTFNIEGKARAMPQDGGIALGSPPLAPVRSPPEATAKPVVAEPLALPPAKDTAAVLAPPDLSDRVATVRKNLQSGTFNLSWRQDIVRGFKELSASDFTRLQTELGESVMTDVFEQLRPFDAALIGSYGPVTLGRGKLNRRRAEFIEDIRDWGSTKEAFYRWVFDSMDTEDVRAVLRILADDQRLHETILSVPGLAEALAARGVTPAELSEKDTSVLQGVGRGLGHFWDAAWSGTIFAGGPGMESTYLPQRYQDLYMRKLAQGFEEAMTPTNIARGAASNVTLGLSDIPFGLYDASKLTVEAAQDLWKGKSGAAAEKLTPVLLMILAAVLMHKAGKAGGQGAALEGPKDLALLEGAELMEAEGARPGAGLPEWDVRKVGQTAEGAERYIGRHYTGEFVEIIADPKQQTVRATRLATGEVVTFDKGQITRGSPLLLTAGDGSLPPPATPVVGKAALTKPQAAAGALPRPAGAAIPPPRQLPPWKYEDFADLGRELAQAQGSDFGSPMVWSVTPDGVVFATPPVQGVPLYAPQGPLPPASYFAGKGQPRTWTLSGPLQPNFTPFDVLPGQSDTTRTLSQVRGARGPNARGAAGSQYWSELNVDSRREVAFRICPPTWRGARTC
ncbi:DUF4157 domain-containing protein [Burkholderiaceae bacterium UC74_6]